MEKGSLRCDVNISVRPAGEPWRTKVEIKNLNSFRFIAAAIEHEAWRQIEAYESEDPAQYPVQETRLYDPERNQTRTMRGKESARDYRYFPDPDLPPLVLEASFLERERANLSEPADSRRARYREQLGLSPADAAALTSERAVSDYFEACLRAGLDARETASWIQNELMGWVGDAELGLHDFSELPIRPRELAEVIRLIRAGRIASNAGRKLLRARALAGPDGAGIEALVGQLGLEQVQDDAQLEEWCRAALLGKEKIIADYRSGKEAALNALLGPVMKASGGRAAPEKVREILKRLLSG
jgi:aspartyl-tRNA(Asn)/glutamyl-tRNA(Gln) amidotransferase subunit B